MIKSDGGQSIFGPSASLIVPRLFLSNFFYAKSTEALRAEGITHIITVLEQKPRYAPFLKGTLHIPLADNSDANILQHLETATEFIKAALAEDPDNKVLVRYDNAKVYCSLFIPIPCRCTV